MADRPGGPRDDERISEPVLDWLDEIAEAEGLSRQAAVEYLVSSYWRLEEIVDLLEAGGEPSTATDERSAAPDDRSDLDDLHARFDNLIDDLQAREAGSSTGDDFMRSVAELGDRLERLENLLKTGAVEPPEPAPEPPSVEDRVDTLEGRLESLRAELGGRSGGDPELAADLDDRLSTVEARLESLHAELEDVARGDIDELAAAVDDVERRADSLAGDLRSVGSRVSALDDTVATEEQLEAMSDQVRSFQGRISRRHDSLHDRVHTEFTHIRTILEHLIEATQANESRLEGTVDELEAALRAEQADREVLAAITRTANRRGVSTADCEHCGESVDLAMLQAAECPHCERAFEDLETTGGLFGLFPSNTLRVRGGRRPDRD
ncbi:MAG: hypothetical protein U5J98_04150 [Halobacteriales archaeon]|nr:hypothetical protein [Halobacteriales archaeon]